MLVLNKQGVCISHLDPEIVAFHIANAMESLPTHRSIFEYVWATVVKKNNLCSEVGEKQAIYAYAKAFQVFKQYKLSNRHYPKFKIEKIV